MSKWLIPDFWSEYEELFEPELEDLDSTEIYIVLDGLMEVLNDNDWEDPEQFNRAFSRSERGFILDKVSEIIMHDRFTFRERIYLTLHLYKYQSVRNEKLVEWVLNSEPASDQETNTLNILIILLNSNRIGEYQY